MKKKRSFDAPARKVLCRHDEIRVLREPRPLQCWGQRRRRSRRIPASLQRRPLRRRSHSAGTVCHRKLVGGFSRRHSVGPIQRIAKSSAEDGMLQRFMYCVPGPPRQGLDRRPSASALKRYAALFPALAALLPRGPEREGERHQHVVFHDRVHQHREAIEASARAMASLPDTSPRLQAALAEWPGLYARPCLVFHLIEVADSRIDYLLGPPGDGRSRTDSSPRR
jgi:hypothetical protein